MKPGWKEPCLHHMWVGASIGSPTTISHALPIALQHLSQLHSMSLRIKYLDTLSLLQLCGLKEHPNVNYQLENVQDRLLALIPVVGRNGNSTYSNINLEPYVGLQSLSKQVLDWTHILLYLFFFIVDVEILIHHNTIQAAWNYNREKHSIIR